MARVVVITGAAGNIGAKLRAHLSAVGGYELRLLDIDPGGDPEIQAADLRRLDSAWSDRFEGADAVVHLAANGNSRAAWFELIEPNLDAMLNVYVAASRHRTRRVVMASSVWTMAGRLDEDTPLVASDADPGANAYGATKLFAERVARAMWAGFGVTTVALRLGGCRVGDNLPGPSGQAWEDQCWLSNRDACAGLELAITAPATGVVVANMVSDNPESRWSLEEARSSLGYVPQDRGYVQPKTPKPPRRRLRVLVRRLLGRT